VTHYALYHPVHLDLSPDESAYSSEHRPVPGRIAEHDSREPWRAP
jgi:hypothetical protein